MHRRTAIFLPFVFIGLAACQTTPEPIAAEVSEIEHAVAVIETVDRTTREVLLTGPDNHKMVMRLGPEVQNFAQLRPGQRVAVTYRNALAAQIAEAGTSNPERMAVERTRAAKGQLPAADASGVAHVRVTITAVDGAKNTVSFVGPRNITRTVAVKDPNMRALLRSLRPGSQVDLTYSEAVSVKVEPI